MSSSNAGPPNQQTLDPYRTIAAAIQKPLAPYLPPGAAPTLSELLGVNDQSYKERVEGKTIILDETGITKSGSSLVTGKKRHRGDPMARKAAREAYESKTKRRAELGLTGLRKCRKRGGIVNKGQTIEYESFIPLHHLHTAYIISLLGLSPLPTSSTSTKLPPGLGQDAVSVKLLKADFTGIEINVESSRNPSLNNLKGIVIEETSSTFRIICRDNKTRVIPKEGTQFGLSFPAFAPTQNDPVDYEQHLRVCPRIEMSLLGTNFGYRSGDRAGRKFKLAQGVEGNGWGECWVKGEWQDVFPPTTEKRRKKGGKREPSTNPIVDAEKGIGAGGMRKRGKSRRKDPLAGGTRDVVY